MFNKSKPIATIYEDVSTKRIIKRGSVLKTRGGCYNYRFKLYKWLTVATKTVFCKALMAESLSSLVYVLIFKILFCRGTFEKLSKMSKTSMNRIFIVLIVCGFVIFKFVIYVPTSSFQNMITNVVTNVSQSNSMEEIESTSEDFMRVSLDFEFIYLTIEPILTLLAILD